MFVFVVVCHEFADGTVLSKSKITMCVKDKNTDPFNVVEGKSCDKKLVLTKAVTSGQVWSKMLAIGRHPSPLPQNFKEFSLFASIKTSIRDNPPNLYTNTIPLS